jgi:hypothetical protein
VRIFFGPPDEQTGRFKNQSASSTTGREGRRKILSESASSPPDSRGLSRATAISALFPRLRSRGRTEGALPLGLTTGGQEQGARNVVASSPIVRCGSGFRLVPVLASFFFLL